MGSNSKAASVSSATGKRRLSYCQIAICLPYECPGDGEKV